eukprot:9494260-Pyramimonas_sp.AAC.1
MYTDGILMVGAPEGVRVRVRRGVCLHAANGAPEGVRVGVRGVRLHALLHQPPELLAQRRLGAVRGVSLHVVVVC